MTKLNKKHKIILFFIIALHIVLLILTISEKLNFLFNDASLRKGKAADFFAIYQAGDNILKGESLYLDTEGVSTPYSFPFRYLPFSGYSLGIIFNAFSPYTAYFLEILFYEFLILINIFLTWKLSKNINNFLLASVPWLLFSPYLIEIYMGQWTFLLSSLLFYTIYGLLKNSRLVNLYILAPLIKPNALIIAPILLRYKRLKTLIFTTLGLIITSLPYFILFREDISTFLHNFSDSWYSHGGNLGFKSLYYLTAIKYLSIPLPRLWFLGFMTISGLFILYLTFKYKNKVLAYALWICYYFLIYKDVWEHHYVLLMPIFALIFTQFNLSINKLLSKKYLLLLISFLLIASPSIFSLQYIFRYDAPVEPDELSVFYVLIYHSVKIIGVISLFIWSVLRMTDKKSK